MRNVSSNVDLLIRSGNAQYFNFVEFIGKTAPIRDTTLPYDMVFEGNTYSSDNGLFIIEQPRQSTVVDREVYKLTYLDPNFEFRARFETGFVGTQLIVRIGFINTTESVLGGAQPGMPLLNPEDCIIAYVGNVDTHGYSTTDDSNVIVAIESSSPMASLSMVKPFNTSKEAQRQVDATDSAYDYIYIGSRSINLLWGKA